MCIVVYDANRLGVNIKWYGMVWYGTVCYWTVQNDMSNCDRLLRCIVTKQIQLCFATENGNLVVHKYGANVNDRSVYRFSWQVIGGRSLHVITNEDHL